MEFTQLQYEEANVGMLGEKQINLSHLDPNHILLRETCVKTLWLVVQLDRFPSVIDELDVRPIPLILTSFAIHGLIQ